MTIKKLSDRQIFERSIRESDVVGAIRNLLELNGAKIFPIIERIPWGRTVSTPGIPDLHGRFPGPTQFWIEVKRPGGKRRPAQIEWIEDAKRDGVIAFFADSVEAMVEGFSEYGIHIKGLPKPKGEIKP